MATRDVLRSAVRAALVAYGASASLPALSLGLGEIEMQSFLNEPLRAEVELLDTRALTVDDIRIRLAGNDDFNRLGIDRSFFLTGIKFDVEVDEATGRGVIRLSTEEAVLEPYLDLIIEARWPSGRLLREYTVLVDPPAFRQEVVTVSASERVDDPDPDKPALAPESRPEPVSEEAREGVALRESSLPPGEMPDRDFSAETEDMPRAGSRYMVRRDETLWQIAAQGRPEGISVQQAMLDIQRLNPEAFINGNINQIKAGYIIYLPTAGEVSSDDLARALEEVREQNKEWRSGRAAPGVTAAATLRVSADPVDVSGDAASESAADAGSTAAPDTTTERAGGDMDVADDTADLETGAAPSGADIASAELAAQLQEMTERADTLEQIVSVKDEQIATLEQALREARESAAATAATPTAPAPQTTPAPTPQPDRSAGAAIPWMPVAGGAAAVLLAILVFVLRRRRADDGADLESAASDDGEDVFAGVSLKKDKLAAETDVDDGEADSVVEAAPERGQAVSPVKSEDLTKQLDPGGSRGYGERKHDDYIDEAAAGDALAEADIYIAYGRYLQAIELLEGAIADEPANSAYRLKLIELYVDMGEEQRAAEQLEELRAHGDADAVARAEGLLGGVVSAVPGSADDTTAAAASTGSIDYEHTPAPEPESVPEAPSEDAAEWSLDFDTEHKLESDAEDLTAEAERDSLGEVAGAPADEPQEPPVFDLDLEELATADKEGEAVDDLTAEPLEFDLLEIEEPGEGAADELDLSDADDELDLTDALVASGADDETGDEEDSGEELMIADDADQMATKLDLARAYIDMGDNEGARVILEEVAESGTDEQQQEASELLSRIG